jgi:hypothetical protein
VERIGKKKTINNFSPRSTLHAPRPTLYLLQDAHTNESGQINVAKTLDLILKNEKDIKYVFTEAGIGDNSLSFFQGLAPKGKRELASKIYLKKGLLHGAEYLQLTNNPNFILWGVEDLKLYQEALNSYKDVATQREDFESHLRKIEQTIEILKEKILNPRLFLFEKSYVSAMDQKICLSEYFEILLTQARAHEIRLNNYPNLSKLEALREKESRIDFNKANEESLLAVQSLSPQDQEELMSLSEQSEYYLFKLGEEKKEQKAYFSYLEEKLLAYSVERGADRKEKTKKQPFSTLYAERSTLGPYRELFKYFNYLHFFKTLDLKTVLQEQKMLEKSLFERLASTDDEKNLLKSQEVLRYLKKLLRLTLTPEEFKEYKSLTQNFQIKELSGFLNRKLMEQRTHYDKAVFLKDGFDNVVARAENFYMLTEERDKHFIATLLQKMRQENQSKAVLIAGGYHTQNLKSLFKQLNISFYSITPQVFHETNIARYEKLLLNQSFLEPPLLKVSAGADHVMLWQLRGAEIRPLSNGGVLQDLTRALGIPNNFFDTHSASRGGLISGARMADDVLGKDLALHVAYKIIPTYLYTPGSSASHRIDIWFGRRQEWHIELKRGIHGDDLKDELFRAQRAIQRLLENQQTFDGETTYEVSYNFESSWGSTYGRVFHHIKIKKKRSAPEWVKVFLPGKPVIFNGGIFVKQDAGQSIVAHADVPEGFSVKRGDRLFIVLGNVPWYARLISFEIKIRDRGIPIGVPWKFRGNLQPNFDWLKDKKRAVIMSPAAHRDGLFDRLSISFPSEEWYVPLVTNFKIITITTIPGATNAVDGARLARQKQVNWWASMAREDHIRKIVKEHKGKHPSVLKREYKGRYPTPQSVNEGLEERDVLGWPNYASALHHGKHADGALYNKARQFDVSLPSAPPRKVDSGSARLFGMVPAFYSERAITESEAVSFLAQVHISTKGQTGTLVIDRSVFSIQKKGDEVIFFAFGKEIFRGEKNSVHVVAKEAETKAEVTLSMSDLKLFVQEAYKTIDEFTLSEPILKALNEKKAVLVVDLNPLAKNKNVPLNDLIEMAIPALVREAVRFHGTAEGRNAVVLIQSDQDLREVVKLQLSGSKDHSFIVMDEKQLPEGYRDPKQRITITSPNKNVKEGALYFFLQAIGRGDVPNFHAAFKIALMLARTENLEASSKEFQEILRLFEFVLGQTIKDRQELISVLQGQIKDSATQALYALGPIVRIPINKIVQGARLVQQVLGRAA